MDLSAFGERRNDRTSLQNKSNGEAIRVGESPSNHLLVEQDGFFRRVWDQRTPSYHTIPREHIWARHFIEQATGVADIAAIGERGEGDELGECEGGGGGGEFEEMGVDLAKGTHVWALLYQRSYAVF